MIHSQPPKWADGFLKWYCDPELLEEIQGDAHELYFERIEYKGKGYADRRYIWDVIRFCRTSNIRQVNENHKPGYLDVLWNLDFKIALRNAGRNKLIFSVKMLSLALCLAFALLVSVFVLQEFSFDKHIADHQRVYRVSMDINVNGKTVRDADTPELLAEAIIDEIPEVEMAAWYHDGFHNFRHVFRVGEKSFHSESAIAVTSGLTEILDIKFIKGTSKELDYPYSIVLTESAAQRFFGDEDPLGQMVELNDKKLDVVGVIKDPSGLSHLSYTALVSAETLDYCYCWESMGISTYIKLMPNTDIKVVEHKLKELLDRYKMDMARGVRFLSAKNLTVSPILTNVTAIHLDNSLSYDTTRKRSLTNLHLLTATAILFFLAGFINFLNLSLAELTLSFKRMGLLQIFGGALADHSKAVVANTLLSVFVVFPLMTLFFIIGMNLAEMSGIMIASELLLSPVFLFFLLSLILLFIFSSWISSRIVSKSKNILTIIKGKLTMSYKGVQFREVLVGVQLSFSIVMIALIFIVVNQFTYINEADKGFEDRNVMVLKMPLDGFESTEPLEKSLVQLTGIEKVAASSFYSDEIEWGDEYDIETNEGKKSVHIKEEYWGFGFTDLLGIKVVEGRDFDESITSDKEYGFLLNETAVKEFGWENPIGKKISHGYVIGVVKDFNLNSMHKKIEPLIVYHGAGKHWGGDSEYVFLRLNTITSPELIHEIEKVYHDFYPDTPMDWEYLDASLANLYRHDYQVRDIFQVGLFISVLLSCLGIFSISALLLIIRAKEMSIRKVVGASQTHLFGLHIKKFLKFILVALLVAWPVAYALSDHWLNSFAYRIKLNIWYFVVPGLFTLAIILLTSSFHGIKSAKANPVDVLNQE